MMEKFNNPENYAANFGTPGKLTESLLARFYADLHPF